MVHIIVGYFHGCRKPLWLIYFTVIYLWTLVILFANFYLHAYKTNKLKIAQSTKIHLEQSHGRIDIKAGGDMKLD